ncbi:DHA2 family methylenomycin A resistance protein-like MFS transporter/DHA2 family multidrug resistance protein-like MFS transporter [Kineococcus rhizosphaerae]|uniref:DHA2 family methylenomycin A resistance protein-like MFS transporter/DHA2 family multidrug resistance protein-like MFS transporter n=1 Tax=Kineococcus rhizosphaerae TaxID=559628 RepID=A0A2T0QXT3_9ACTN|nr:DHA2 family methylenomycin A resistance protein-like MFS transporter/DHA2 family multidrug resistance protein-like MFS transporter [Kineococcus rhizosphaerae]
MAVACLGMTMSFLTITATTTALTSLAADLRLGPVGLVWTSSAYALALAALVLSSGAFGDLAGRRTVFQLGTAVMGAGAVVTATAGTPAAVITGEVVLGAGAALVVPNSLALVTGAFTDPRRRASAVGVWAACSGVGLAVGPLVAGALLDAFTWHAVFLVDVAVAVVVLAASPFVLPNPRVPGRGVDVPGTLLATVAVAGLVVTVVEAGRSGLAPVPVLAALGTLLAAAGFVAVEKAQRRPVVRFGVFADRRTVAALLVAGVALFSFTGLALLTTLQLQRAQGLSPLASGVHLLPLMGAYVVVSSLAAAVVRRAGVRATLGAGLGATLVGVLVLHSTGAVRGPADAGLVLVGAGLGLLIAPTTAVVVGGVPAELAGMAGSVVTTVRQVGAALGGSVLGTVVTHRLPEHAGALTPAVHDGFLVAALVLLLVLLTTAVLLRPAARTVQETPEGILA